MDFVWVCCPDEGILVLTSLGEELVDGGLEIDNLK